MVRGSRIVTSIGRKEVVFVPGETVEVRASASGNPEPTVEWSRGSTVIGETGSTRVLSNGALVASDMRDEEHYTFSASSDVGSDSESISFVPASEEILRYDVFRITLLVLFVNSCSCTE